MVLYHVSTTYQLLYCIVHRLARHSQEEAGLLMVEYIQPESERKAFVSRLENTGWFSFVRLVPENQFKLKRGNALTEQSSPQEIESVIRNVCACVESWKGFDLSEFSRIYIGSDQWSFGIYCLANHIPHVYIEDASGMLSQRERYMQITKEINLTNYVISQYLHGAGTSEYETARLCDERNFINGFTDDKAENFSIYDALRYEIPQRVPEILAFYGASPIHVEDGKPICMYMTQYLKSMAIKDLDVQEEITNMLVDYFSDGCRLIIKPHPKDIWLNYHRMFPDAILLPHKMNSELLPFLFERPIDRVLTASSTSVGGMAPFAHEVYQFTTEIETRYEHLHAIYIAAMVAKELARCSQQGLSISYSGINRTQVENFLKILKTPMDKDGLRIHITGSPDSDAPTDAAAVLMVPDSEQLGWWIPPDKKVWQIHGSLCPEEGSLVAEQEIQLYLVLYSAQLEACVSSFAFVSPLRYSKAKLYVQTKALRKEEAAALLIQEESE